MTRGRFLSLAGVALLSACGKKKVKQPPPPPPPPPAPAPSAKAQETKPAPAPARKPSTPPPSVPPGTKETGMASWYGHPYHGRPAADGEIYDMEALVAAHRTLPFQTWVRVRNMRNDKTVDVRIIDRGPFVGGRIIDLSHAAAQQIELIGPGVAQVELTIISAPQEASPAAFGVQVGAFRERANADRLQQTMMTTYGAARIVRRSGDPDLWRVLAGREATQERAEALAKRIREEQKVQGAFVVRLDPEVQRVP